MILPLVFYGDPLLRQKAEKIPETRADGYKNAVNLLKEIGRGNVSLGVPGIPEDQPGGGAAVVSSPDRLFTRDKMKGLF